MSMFTCGKCEHQWVGPDDSDCPKCSSLATPICSAFHDLTLDGLKALAERLEDANGSVLATMGTAKHAGHDDLVGKLSLMNTTLNAMTERVKALRKDMLNEKGEP